MASEIIGLPVRSAKRGTARFCFSNPQPFVAGAKCFYRGSDIYRYVFIPRPAIDSTRRFAQLINFYKQRDTAGVEVGRIVFATGI